MKKISPAQKIQFDLLKMTQFNEFDGRIVADSLEKHDDLWTGFVFGSFSCFPLLVLRDIETPIEGEFGSWNGSELYILAAKGKEKELKELAKTWESDELNYEPEELMDKMMGSNHSRDFGWVLRAWWD